MNDAELIRLKEIINQTFKGGAGSGNFGHAGRPGEIGGSAASDKYAFKPPSELKPELRRGSVQDSQKRQKERAEVMKKTYGVNFSLATSNPIGVEEGKKMGMPGIGLPRAIYDKSVDSISDPEKINLVKEAAQKWGGQSKYLTYTTAKYATGLSFQEIFGVVKYLKEQDPYSVQFTVDRLGNNTIFAIKKYGT